MRYDALILGAGPAGTSVARLLAAWGHRVLVVDRGGGDPPHRLAESIPPSAQRVLATLGTLPAIEDVRFRPWRGNVVSWGDPSSKSDRARIESFPVGVAGYQVKRAVFDRCLRRLATEAGAEMRSGLVREARASDNSVTVESAGRVETVSARFLLDCSGRAGVVARQGHRRQSALRSIALAGSWRSDVGWQGLDDTYTTVASYADGWAWSLSAEPGVRDVTVMIDPVRTDRKRGASAREIYLAELKKVAAFESLLAGATMLGGPTGADATAYDAEHYAGPGWLLVGDAGSAIDPLSSFGVKKALVSGWLAAIVVHTACATPAMTDAALQYFNRREHEMVAATRQQSAGLAGAASSAAHPFWLARATSTDDFDLSGSDDAPVLARDPEVLAAFDDLRRRDTVQFVPGPQWRVEPRPAIRERLIALEDHLVLPGWPNGLRYLRNVDLLLLARLAPLHRDVGSLCEAVTRAQPGVILPDVLGALSVLIARGALAARE